MKGSPEGRASDPQPIDGEPPSDYGGAVAKENTMLKYVRDAILVPLFMRVGTMAATYLGVVVAPDQQDLAAQVGIGITAALLIAVDLAVRHWVGKVDPDAFPKGTVDGQTNNSIYGVK